MKSIFGFAKKYVLNGFAVLVASLFAAAIWEITVSAAERTLDSGEELVICIDAGHGGSNEGTLNGWLREMDMTIVTAKAMCAELETYEGVKVIMTRTDDSGSTLLERCELAVENQADLLVSVHYNASAAMNLYGSEIWIPSKEPFRSYGYQFGYEFCKEMSEKGMFIRGIKTRLNEDGEDYYGIIREGYNLGLTCVILEHCHVDATQDKQMCDTLEDLEAFGVSDATALAKYFGLKKQDGSVDYSEYASNSLTDISSDFITDRTRKDESNPERVELELIKEDPQESKLEFRVKANDSDGMMLYYDYSINNGLTYSELQPWPGADALTGAYDEEFVLSLAIPNDLKAAVIVRGYNGYDLSSESQVYTMEAPFSTVTVVDGENDENSETDLEKNAIASNGQADATSGDGFPVDENGNPIIFSEETQDSTGDGADNTEKKNSDENASHDGFMFTILDFGNTSQKEQTTDSQDRALSNTQIYIIIAVVIIGSIFVVLLIINLISMVSDAIRSRQKKTKTTEATVDYLMNRESAYEMEKAVNPLEEYDRMENQKKASTVSKSSKLGDDFWLDEDLYDDET